ncbi:alpha/beta hydrolase [Pelomyxa schiedti]|nr:alpha/beta hydrolase [Pelomyxa schiedti]
MLLPAVLLVVCCCWAATVIGGESGSVSVTVTAHYPSLVGSMWLRGDSCGLSWDKGLSMSRVSGEEAWALAIKCTSNTTLQIKVLVGDSTWQIGANSIFNIQESTSQLDVYPWFYTKNGVYQYIRNVISPQLHNKRDLVIYTPPSFYENTLKTYKNVLVMHDGQNLFNASTSYLGIAWQCQDTVDSLVNSGDMEEIIIVGVDNTDDRNNELTFRYDTTEGFGGKNQMYLDFIEQTVLPLVNSTFSGRLAYTRTSLGILGSSFGGITSCFGCWTRSEVYGRCGCMSSTFSWADEAFLNHILQASIPQHSLTIYLDSGDTGENLPAPTGDHDDMQQTIDVRNRLEELGWILGDDLFYYLDIGGQHNEYYWGQRFWIPMTDLYPVVAQ